MKKRMQIYIWVLLSLATTLVVACSNKGGSSSNGGGGTVTALTPTTQCLMPNGVQGNCNNAIYTNTLGYSPYTTNGSNFYNNSNGFCGCPVGTQPVYNNGWGLGCVAVNYLPSTTNYGYATYGYYVGSNSWTNVPLSSTPISQMNQVSGNCSQTVGYACDSRVSGSCGLNGVCQTLQGGSPYGVCSYQMNNALTAQVYYNGGLYNGYVTGYTAGWLNGAYWGYNGRYWYYKQNRK